MSTNPNELNPIEASKEMIAKSKRSTDRTLRALNLDMEQENTLVQDTPNGRLQKVLKIWRGIKPVFSVLSSLPLIPSTWRSHSARSSASSRRHRRFVNALHDERVDDLDGCISVRTSLFLLFPRVVLPVSVGVEFTLFFLIDNGATAHVRLPPVFAEGWPLMRWFITVLRAIPLASDVLGFLTSISRHHSPPLVRSWSRSSKSEAYAAAH